MVKIVRFSMSGMCRGQDYPFQQALNVFAEKNAKKDLIDYFHSKMKFGGEEEEED
jgi:hypothetical protein